MSKNTKTTVTVQFGWVSSNPTFSEFLVAVYRDMGEQKFFSQGFVKRLQELLPMNDGKPFNGHTLYEGSHTNITIEAPSLSKAIDIVRTLEGFLKYEFSKVPSFCGGFHWVTYAGTTLECLVEMVETALQDAQQDIKGTRWFLPSKRIQRLRIVYEKLFVRNVWAQ